MTRRILFVSLLAVGLAAASNAQAHEDGDYQTGEGVGNELLHGLGIPHSHGGYGRGGYGRGDGYRGGGYRRAYGYGHYHSRHEYLHENGIPHGGYNHQLHDYGIPHEHAY